MTFARHFPALGPALLAAALCLAASPALAQNSGALDLNQPAKQAFGGKSEPAKLAPRAIGTYTRGCVAGAEALPINGPTWQVMRLSRNRNWAHPALVKMLERMASEVPRATPWRGLLIGDLAQPRGGPMLTGHASHQLGLDADIWLTEMPERELTREERESISATSVITADKLDVDPKIWNRGHTAVIRLAAKQPEVERIFVNAAIKKALCREAGSDRGWLSKVRPWFGHHYHFHVRIKCPADSPDCKGHEPAAPGDGCDELAYWFREEIRFPKPAPPGPPKPGIKVADMPPACRQVLLAR